MSIIIFGTVLGSRGCAHCTTAVGGRWPAKVEPLSQRLGNFLCHRDFCVGGWGCCSRCGCWGWGSRCACCDRCCLFCGGVIFNDTMSPVWRTKVSGCRMRKGFNCPFLEVFRQGSHWSNKSVPSFPNRRVLFGAPCRILTTALRTGSDLAEPRFAYKWVSKQTQPKPNWEGTFGVETRVGALCTTHGWFALITIDHPYCCAWDCKKPCKPRFFQRLLFV